MASKKLMSALDSAAEKLLARHFPDQTGDDTVMHLDPEIQIKAFSAVVNYYGPRTKLGGDEERKESGLSRLQQQLHGRGKTGRKADKAQGGADAVAQSNGAGSTDQFPTATTDPNAHGDPAGGSE